MTSGGERDSLAPVIPLFGGVVPDRPESRPETAERSPFVLDADRDDDDPVAEAAEAAVEEVIDREDGVDVRQGLAWHPTWTDERALRAADAPSADDATGASRAEAAEKALLKKLRTRSLSVSEARGALREHELDDASIESVLASMVDFGYLDDAALAEQLVHVGVDRKGQGRQLIAQTLAKRGIPRDIADEALAALPDDDLERALDYARGKARSLQSLDRDTALRRLSGQLARRGYGGSLAMTAARIALDERPAGTGGVRFR